MTRAGDDTETQHSGYNHEFHRKSSFAFLVFGLASVGAGIIINSSFRVLLIIPGTMIAITAGISYLIERNKGETA